MAKLKTSEKRLLALFLAALFLAVNFFIYRQVSAVQRRAEVRMASLEQKQLEIEDLFAEEELWTERRAWLEARQPVFTTRDQVDLELLEAVRGAAQKFGITLDAEKLPEPEELPFAVQSVARINATGDMEAIVRWLYELQKPEAFRAVTYFQLKPQKEDPSVLQCEVQVERWYAKG